MPINHFIFVFIVFMNFTLATHKYRIGHILDSRKSLLLHISPFQIYKQFYIFGCPKITFDRISHHIRSIRNINVFFLNSQNDHQRPFWMPENHFYCISHNFRLIINRYLNIQINTQLFWNLFHTVAVGGHFGSPKITFIAYPAVSD